MAETETNTTTAIRGFPVAGILLTVFVLCKAFEYGPIAQWSWWWVLAPAWIPVAFVGAFWVLGGFAALVAFVLTALLERK